jgi:plastocyanin
VLVSQTKPCGPVANCKTVNADCTCAACVESNVGVSFELNNKTGLCSASFQQVWSFLTEQRNITLNTGDSVDWVWSGGPSHNLITWSPGTQEKLSEFEVNFLLGYYRTRAYALRVLCSVM